MKLINRNVDYSLRALADIAKEDGRVVSVSYLSRKENIPKPFLRRLLQILSKRKIVKSYKGKIGGFRLLKRPDQVLLIDIIEIFQGPINLVDCLFKRNICPKKNVCILRKKIENIEKRLISEIKTISLANLIREGGYGTR